MIRFDRIRSELYSEESPEESESETESEEKFPELVEDARDAALASRATIAAAEMRERRAQIQQEIEQARQVEINEEVEFVAVFSIILDPPLLLVEARRSTRITRAPKSRD